MEYILYMDQFCSMLAGLGEGCWGCQMTQAKQSFKQAPTTLGAKQTDTTLLSPEKMDGIRDTRKAGP